MAEEAVAGHLDADEGAGLTDGEAAEGTDVGSLLIPLVLEGAEIVLAGQNPGSPAHPPHVQGRWVPEDEGSLEKGPCGAIPDVVAVELPLCRVARMKLRCDRLGLADEYVRRQVVIDRPLQRRVRQRAVGLEMRREAEGVDAAVGAGAAVEVGLFLQDAGERLFEALLDRPVFELALPALVAGALKTDYEADRPLGAALLHRLASLMGKTTTNSVPSPTSLDTRTLPSFFSMMECVIASPRPVPSSLLV